MSCSMFSQWSVKLNLVNSQTPVTIDWLWLWLTAKACGDKQSVTDLTEPTQRVLFFWSTGSVAQAHTVQSPKIFNSENQQIFTLSLAKFWHFFSNKTTPTTPAALSGQGWPTSQRLRAKFFYCGTAKSHIKCPLFLSLSLPYTIHTDTEWNLTHLPWHTYTHSPLLT